MSALVDMETGEVTVRYTDEASLRSSLASFAEYHGWDVKQEVVIPEWGRLDLVLSIDDWVVYAVELKLDISKPAKARRAFQQASGYQRYLSSLETEPPTVVLAAPDIDHACVDTLRVAYGEVLCRSVAHLMGMLVVDERTLYSRLLATDDRLSAANARQRALQTANARIDAEFAAWAERPAES